MLYKSIAEIVGRIKHLLVTFIPPKTITFLKNFYPWLNPVYQDQGQIQIEDPGEQTVQGRLVLDRAEEQDLPGLGGSDGQALEPLRPAGSEVSLDTDHVLVWQGVTHHISPHIDASCFPLPPNV